MIQQAIHDVIEGQDLSFEAAKEVMNEIMSGETTPAQMAAFLTGLRMKGETIDEITACATVMREKGLKLEPNFAVIDIVGTGGDEAGTFNISTTSAFVVAAGGVPVAKHGNRSVSSKSGAADVLENLGVNLKLTVEQLEQILKDTGMCFMFAQSYHSSMKYAGPVRKEMGVRTIFNILGPLANPAGATMQLLGVYDKKLVEPLARVLVNLGVKSAMVVYGMDKLDEISMSAETFVCEVKDGSYKTYYIEPEQFGFHKCDKKELEGGTPEENAEITLKILDGEKGPRRDAVVLNSGAALYIAGRAESMEEGVRMAEEIIDSGKAKRKLEEFAACSRS